MNIKPSVKYGILPENIESKSLSSERLKTLFNMHRIEKTQKLNVRLDRYDKKIYQKKKEKVKRKFKRRRKSLHFSRKNQEKKCSRKIL